MVQMETLSLKGMQKVNFLIQEASGLAHGEDEGVKGTMPVATQDARDEADQVYLK